MVDLVRQEILAAADIVVVKVGTNVLTGADGQLQESRIRSLAEQMVRIRQSGRRVVLVSSGAVGAGMGRLGLTERPTHLRDLQACAAVGQSFLMGAYEEAWKPHGFSVAQLLLTAGDFDNRTRYLNIRNTLLTLLEWPTIPIINENDSVSVDEIRFGDNDQLAAMVTNLLQAPLLILLSVVDGLHTADPGNNPNAELVPTVWAIDDGIRSMAGKGRSLLGTGGMQTKLRAAHLATSAGESMILANGTQPNILDRLFEGEALGTLFVPEREAISARKRWLGYMARARGTLLVDSGARMAIEQKKTSLLPIGVRKIQGEFRKGDLVSICDLDNTEFARGLCNYSHEEAARIAGLRSEQIEEILGGVPYEEIVHRDNLIVIL